MLCEKVIKIVFVLLLNIMIHKLLKKLGLYIRLVSENTLYTLPMPFCDTEVTQHSSLYKFLLKFKVTPAFLFCILKFSL